MLLLLCLPFLVYVEFVDFRKRKNNFQTHSGEKEETTFVVNSVLDRCEIFYTTILCCKVEMPIERI